MTILLLVLAASGIVMWDARFGFHDRTETDRGRGRRRTSGRRDRAVDHPCLRGDLGQGHGARNDPKLS
jgi:hypothetical protein